MSYSVKPKKLEDLIVEIENVITMSETNSNFYISEDHKKKLEDKILILKCGASQ